MLGLWQRSTENSSPSINKQLRKCAYSAVDITLENKKYKPGFYSLSFTEVDKKIFGALSIDKHKTAAKLSFYLKLS